MIFISVDIVSAEKRINFSLVLPYFSQTSVHLFEPRLDMAEFVTLQWRHRIADNCNARMRINIGREFVLEK